MIFESHAHYDDARFDEDRDDVINALKEAGVTKVINIGADMDSSLRSIELSKRYDFVYAAVGVHPHEVSNMTDKDLEILTQLTAYKKVVGIGEIGLDYYYEYSPREVQKLWFREQIEIAKGVGLPVIIHSREASQDTFDIIKESNAKEAGGVIHCFAGSKEMAKLYVDMGFYLGIGGVVTYGNAHTLKEVVNAIPLSSLVIETDCPYLSPVPNRGQRNDSRNLVYIVKAIAQLKGVSPEEVMETTYQNGMELFIKPLEDSDTP